MTKPSPKHIFGKILLGILNILLLIIAIAMAKDTGWATAIFFLVLCAVFELAVWGIAKGVKALKRKSGSLKTSRVRKAIEQEPNDSIRRKILEACLANKESNAPLFDATENLSDKVLISYNQLCETFTEVAKANSIRQAEIKRNAVHTTYKTALEQKANPYILLPKDIPAVFLPVEGETLYFLPTFIIKMPMVMSLDFQAIPYDQAPMQLGLASLNAKISDIPADTKDYEIHYTKENQDGTPDMRYKDNPQYAIVHYGDCLLSPWRTHLLISKQTLGQKLAEAYEQHREIVSKK